MYSGAREKRITDKCLIAMEKIILLTIVPLIGGYVLDLLLGDPYHFPHPVKVFGNFISFGEKHLNKKKFRFLKGTAFSLLALAMVYIFFAGLIFVANQLWVWVTVLVSTVFVYYGLANRCLIDEGRAVFNALEKEGLEAGRRRLSYIVGRDTSNLTPQQIRTAVFETMAENLSDGVVAPLFWFAIGGIPAMMTYKMVNTLDSMIGYKSDRYFYFGKFAARVDDVANFIPARLTSIVMVLVTFSRRGLLFAIKFGHKHSSPNSGYPEAALAGILNCTFGGPNVYHGKLVEKPYIGIQSREIRPREIEKVANINHAVTAISIVISMCVALLFA